MHGFDLGHFRPALKYSSSYQEKATQRGTPSGFEVSELMLLAAPEATKAQHISSSAHRQHRT